MITHSLSHASLWTWQFLRDAPFRPREETITESLLTEFVRTGGSGCWIHKATIIEEVLYGLDWAWALETKTGWVVMLVQAKQIDGRRFGVYRELRKPSALTQVDNLISAAEVFNAVPIYAFYNNELAPFGTIGHPVELWGCARINLRREDPKHGWPWNSGFSPLGVTVAHAEDVRRLVAPAPARSQHAITLNGVAMPWECLMCPSWTCVSSEGASPRISRLAAQISLLNATDGADQLEDSSDSLDGVWREQPTWVQLLMQGGDPTLAEDAPPVSFFLVTGRASDEALQSG